VRIVEGHGANVAAEMLAAGKEYWIGSSSASATAIGRSRELPVRSLAVYYRRTPTVLYSRAEDRIDAPRDLIDKRVGLVKGSTTVDEFRALLAANRIDRSRIREVEVDWNSKRCSTARSTRCSTTRRSRRPSCRRRASASP
jgi:ABC-type nitrate/sulfonate/bicarbonate transport system substrate-binding protein